MHAPLNPLLTDEPITNLDITPTAIRALRQCGAKTIGDAHAVLTSGRFRNYPGVGAQREKALADAIAFKAADLASRAKTHELARRALDELDELDEPLRTFGSITDPIDWDREFGGANSRLREAYRLARHAPAMVAALLFYAQWGVDKDA